MPFHLNYSPKESPLKISHEDKILMIGSCFAENIGEKLRANKFNCLINPNGILFNPRSICQAIRSYIQDADIEITSIVKNNELFYSLDHHGDFCSYNDKLLLADLIQSQNNAHHNLKNCKTLIVTFGSAFAYRHLKTNRIVANCHKIDQQEFKKELLSVQEIVADYILLLNELKQFNPELHIILTVSPVKYLRDGIIENNLSKSILIQSVHEIVNLYKHCSYFPAYELVTDDLRDYRFYKEDMAHPNDQAIHYVWEKFEDVFFDERTKKINKETKEVTLAAKHRPIKENSTEHSEFKKAFLKKCEALETQYPFLDFSEEKTYFVS